MYNSSASFSKLGAVCADPEDEGLPWCFTEAPCATPTDTCTPPPQARGFEADGAFSRAGCECADWASSKWNTTASGATCADPDNSGYKWCFVKAPCLAAHQHADAEPWDYCDSSQKTEKAEKNDYQARLDDINNKFLSEARGTLDAALQKARDCELKLVRAADKMNSQTGPSEADRESCWVEYHHISSTFSKRLEQHNAMLTKMEAANKMQRAGIAAMTLPDGPSASGDAFSASVASASAAMGGMSMSGSKFGITDSASGTTSSGKGAIGVITDGGAGSNMTAFDRIMALQDARNAKAVATMAEANAKKLEVFTKLCEPENKADGALRGFNASKAVSAAVDEMPTYRLTMKECDLGKVKDVANSLQKAIVYGVLKESRKAQESITGAQKVANDAITAAEQTYSTELAEIKKIGAGDEVKQKAAAAMQTTITMASCVFAQHKMAAIGAMKVQSLKLFLESNQTLFRTRHEHTNETAAYHQERIAVGLCDLEKPCCGRGKVVNTTLCTSCICDEPYEGNHCQNIKPDEADEEDDIEARRRYTEEQRIKLDNERRAKEEAENHMYDEAKKNESAADLADSMRDQKAEDEDFKEQMSNLKDAVQRAKDGTRLAMEANKAQKELFGNLTQA
jgi:hypothetical protein